MHGRSEVLLELKASQMVGMEQGNMQDRLRPFLAVILALVCVSCATRPLQGVLIPTVETVSGASRIPILIATTRQRSSDDPGEMFGSERADAMSYAKIVVSIPPDDSRKVGRIQWPASPPGDAQRDFVTVSTDYLDRRAFGSLITSVGKESGRNRAMIFVHGFNNRFDDAAYRLAQIVKDSKAPVIPILFSWPSRGIVSLQAYQHDQESASQSRDDLEQLIEIVALSPRLSEVTIVCHSMGCALTLEALQAKSMRDRRISAKIRNVLLVAPDVDVDQFRDQMQLIGNSRPRFVLFLSQDDHALKISKSLWGGATRLGDIDPRLEPYKTDFERERVVVFDLTHLGGDPHSRAFDEVRSVMGMIERRLAQGQQLDEDTSRTVAAGH
jgi:esterase/lipase superfamily enzyme